MIAYKFLLPGAVGPFSDHRWPVPSGRCPGDWVRGADGPVLCRTAVHGCRREHLPWWLQGELWEAEFEEPARLVGHKLMAPAGRLLRRIGAWDDDAARDFCMACAARAQDHAGDDRIGRAMAADAMTRALMEQPAVTAYIAAHAARNAGGGDAMAAERAWQSSWLTERLGL